MTQHSENSAKVIEVPVEIGDTVGKLTISVTLELAEEGAIPVNESEFLNLTRQISQKTAVHQVKKIDLTADEATVERFQSPQGESACSDSAEHVFDKLNERQQQLVIDRVNKALGSAVTTLPAPQLQQFYEWEARDVTDVQFKRLLLA